MDVPPGDQAALRPQSPLSPQQAADLFAKRRESSRPTPPEQDTAATDQTGPTLAESPEPEPVDLAPDARDGEAESPDQTADPEPQGFSLTDDAKVTLPDGTEMTGQEVRLAMMREADYRRKTQALSEQRGTLEKTVQELSFHLGTMRQQAQGELQKFANTDWPSLFQQNPQEYQTQRLRYEQAQQRWQMQQQAEQDFLGKLEQVQAREKAQRAEEATRYLAEHYPNGWNDGEYNALMEYAVGQGWNRQAVATWDDPLVFLMLRKARAFDEAQKVATKKVVPSTGQKTLRSTRGAAPRPSADQQRKTALEGVRNAGTTVSQLQKAAEVLANRRAQPR